MNLLEALLSKPVGPVLPNRPGDENFTSRIEVKGDAVEVEYRVPEGEERPHSNAALIANSPGPRLSAISGNDARRRPRPGANSDSASSTLVFPAPFSPTSRLRCAVPSRRLAAWLRKWLRVIRSRVMRRWKALGQPALRFYRKCDCRYVAEIPNTGRFVC